MTSASPPLRVLLLSDRSPLSLGIEALLRERMLVEVVCDPDAASALERIRAFQPELVVLGMACREGQPAGEWLRLLEDRPGIRLVALSLQDNRVRIYERDGVRTIPDAAGLLDALGAPAA